MSCTELTFSDVQSITSIPVSDYDASVVALTPTIDPEDFAPDLGNAIVIGLQPVMVDGLQLPLLPLRRSTVKFRDAESDSVAGRSHNVTVSCDVDTRDGEVWAGLLTLERTPSHLLLTFRSGNRAFIAGGRDSYMCTVAQDGAQTKVTFSLHNFMGMQKLV